ncbi:MAG: hypothetical protein KKD17_06760 [Nanoarchaeota archaeon]|nr:hypothetical protein [Nanoarchaeota archaeon]
MTLFNHLFRNRKKAAKKLEMHEEKRMKLWEQHVLSFPEREELSKSFSYKNVDALLADPKALKDVLDRLEATISHDLVHIDDEEKLDHEILADLKRLRSADEAISVKYDIAYEAGKQASMMKLFRIIHETVAAELHAIRLLRKNPANAKELLLALFHLIFHKESHLYLIFLEKQHKEKETHNMVTEIARAVLLEEEFKEEMEKEEQRFVREMVRKMGDDSRHHYRRLAEDIYSGLAGMAGAPVGADGDIVEGIKRLEQLMKTDAVMQKIVKKLRPKYTDEKVKAVILAFRKSYDRGHMMELEAHFAT